MSNKDISCLSLSSIANWESLIKRFHTKKSRQKERSSSALTIKKDELAARLTLTITEHYCFREHFRHTWHLQLSFLIRQRPNSFSPSRNLSNHTEQEWFVTVAPKVSISFSSFEAIYEQYEKLKNAINSGTMAYIQTIIITQIRKNTMYTLHYTVLSWQFHLFLISSIIS